LREHVGAGAEFGCKTGSRFIQTRPREPPMFYEGMGSAQADASPGSSRSGSLAPYAPSRPHANYFPHESTRLSGSTSVREPSSDVKPVPDLFRLGRASHPCFTRAWEAPRPTPVPVHPAPDHWHPTHHHVRTPIISLTNRRGSPGARRCGS